MADTLHIHDLIAHSRIGVTEEERAAPQELRLDLELSMDTSAAGVTDSVEDAIDYAQLVATVRDFVEQHSCNLLEALAEEVARLILQNFPTHYVMVRIKKRALPDISYAAVEITRRLRRH